MTIFGAIILLILIFIFAKVSNSQLNSLVKEEDQKSQIKYDSDIEMKNQTKS